MLTDYIQTAMRNAKYEILGNSTFYGEIPGLDGVFANAGTLEECREQLQEVLEGWIILGLKLGHPIPDIDGVRLTIEHEVV